jgi:hypothetical protein
VNTWQIIQRQNKSALTVGSVTAAIPAYVEPAIGSFRAYSVWGEPALQEGDPVEALEQGIVNLLCEFSDPDGLVTAVRIYENPSQYSDWEWPIVQYGDDWDASLMSGGILIPYQFYSPGEYTPLASVVWKDPDGVEHETEPVELSNAPITMVEIETSIADASITVFQTASVTITPEDMVSTAEMDWGD